jgi:hypothetical protein
MILGYFEHPFPHKAHIDMIDEKSAPQTTPALPTMI